MYGVTKSIKIPLYPTKEQIIIFKELSHQYTIIGNKVADIINNSLCGLNDKNIRAYLKSYISSQVSSLGFIVTMTIKEKLQAFSKYGHLNNKDEKITYKSFPVRCDANRGRLSRVYSDDLEYIKIPSVKTKVKLSYKWTHNYIKKHSIDDLDKVLNRKKQTSRIVYDGKYWYLVYSYDDYVDDVELTNSSLGVDLGLKTLAVTSDNEYYNGVDKDKVVKLTQRIKKLQRIQSRKERHNTESNNLTKIILKIHKYQRRLKNLRMQNIITIANKIKSKHYSHVYFERLNIKGMLRNKKLAWSIQIASWYKLYQTIKYKCEWQGTQVSRIDRFYPSSKLCSRCKSIKDDLKLSDRVYKCNKCGLIIDRDYNASINIRDKGMEDSLVIV